MSPCFLFEGLASLTRPSLRKYCSQAQKDGRAPILLESHLPTDREAGGKKLYRGPPPRVAFVATLLG